MDFNEKIDKISDKALKCVEDFFNDEMGAEKKIKEAQKHLDQKIRLIDQARKKDQGDKGLSLRLIKFLPPDKVQEYIQRTNPELKPLLLDKPSKKK